MITLKRIFPECDVDTLLVELIFQRGKPPHYSGISKVGKALMQYDEGNFIIGVIDTDKFKRPDPHIEKFSELIDDRLDTEGLLIRKVPNTNKHIIRIHPEFEPWMWELAKKANIDSTIYGFGNYDTFEDTAKKIGLSPNKDLKKFINAIVAANPPAIQTLRSWLEKATV